MSNLPVTSTVSLNTANTMKKYAGNKQTTSDLLMEGSTVTRAKDACKFPSGISMVDYVQHNGNLKKYYEREQQQQQQQVMAQQQARITQRQMRMTGQQNFSNMSTIGQGQGGTSSQMPFGSRKSIIGQQQQQQQQGGQFRGTHFLGAPGGIGGPSQDRLGGGGGGIGGGGGPSSPSQQQDGNIIQDQQYAININNTVDQLSSGYIMDQQFGGLQQYEFDSDVMDEDYNNTDSEEEQSDTFGTNKATGSYSGPRKQILYVYNANGHQDDQQNYCNSLVIQTKTRRSSSKRDIGKDPRYDKQVCSYDSNNNPEGIQWFPFPVGFRRKAATLDMDQLLEIELLKITEDSIEFDPYEITTDPHGELKTFPKTNVELAYSFKPPKVDPRSVQEANAKIDYLTKTDSMIPGLLDEIYQFLIKERPVNPGLATAQYLYAKSQYQKNVIKPKQEFLQRKREDSIVAATQLSNMSTRTGIPPLPIRVIELKLEDERKRQAAENIRKKKIKILKEEIEVQEQNNNSEAILLNANTSQNSSFRGTTNINNGFNNTANSNSINNNNMTKIDEEVNSNSNTNINNSPSFNEDDDESGSPSPDSSPAYGAMGRGTISASMVPGNFRKMNNLESD